MVYCATYLLVLIDGNGQWSPQVNWLTLLGRSGSGLHVEEPSRCIWKDDKRVGRWTKCGMFGGLGRGQVIERSVVLSFSHCPVACKESLDEAKLRNCSDKRFSRAAQKSGWRGLVAAEDWGLFGSFLPESGCWSGTGFQEDVYFSKLKLMLSQVW